LVLFLSNLHLNAVSIQNDTLQIKESIVIATKNNPKIIPVQTLSGEELKTLSVHSVADAVRYFSGIQIKDYGGIGGLKTVNIRSMGSQHVGVFYDGVEIGNAQNGVVDLGRFSLDNIEAITLYNGQKSQVFQAAKDFASSGSIYMETKVPTFAEGKKSNRKITFKTGSFGLKNTSLTWNQKLSSKIKQTFNAEYLYTTGKYKFTYKKLDGYDTTQTRKNGDLEALRIESATMGILPNGKWSTRAYYYSSERGYPGAAVRESPGMFKHQDRQWDDNFFIQGSLENYFTKNYGLKAKLKYSYDYLHYLSDPRLDVTTMYINNHFKQYEIYSSLSHKFTLSDKLIADISTDLQWNKLNADLTNFVYPRRITSLNAAALSYRGEKIKIQTSILYSHISDHITEKEAKAASDKDKWTPTIMISYDPFTPEILKFRAFYKKIFRMPTLNDLYYTFIGNANLEPEYTEQYDIGLVLNKTWAASHYSNINFNIDLYYNNVKNKIIAMPTSNQFRWTMINLGYVEIRGVDMSLSQRILWGNVTTDLRLNYTYQKAQDKTDKQDPFYGGQIPYIPWHSGSIILNTSYNDWNLNYSFIYTGERYESHANIIENHAQPWYTSDISISKTFLLKNNKCKSALEINNIFNQQYEVVKNYPMPGINFKIVLNYFF